MNIGTRGAMQYCIYIRVYHVSTIMSIVWRLDDGHVVFCMRSDVAFTLARFDA